MKELCEAIIYEESKPDKRGGYQHFFHCLDGRKVMLRSNRCNNMQGYACHVTAKILETKMLRWNRTIVIGYPSRIIRICAYCHKTSKYCTCVMIADDNEFIPKMGDIQL